MKLTILTAVAGILVLAVILELLRRRQLREKYAMLWLAVGLAVLPLAFFPRLLDGVAGMLGVANGVSLVLFLAFVFLLLVCVHLSWEVSQLEEETRTLAEEIALLRAEFHELASETGAQLHELASETGAQFHELASETGAQVEATRSDDQQ